MASFKYDAVLLIGFGGPEKPGDVIPFLKDVTEGKDIPSERLKLVALQYDKIGGSSPYNRLTLEQAKALEKLLKARGLDIPVVVGYAHSSPCISDTIAELAQSGKTRIFAIVMAPHRCPASYDKYLEKVEMARKSLPPLQITYASKWHNRPGFIQAIADHVKEAFAQLSEEEKARHRAELIFTTHCIPMAMAQESPYTRQFEETAMLVTRKVGIPNYQTAYTSRSGRPTEPWLEPDLGDFIMRRTYEAPSACVVAPIGFLVDHVEVLYDIDTLAQEKAKGKNLRIVRAKTVGTHPSFIAMLASLVEETRQEF